MTLRKILIATFVVVLCLGGAQKCGQHMGEAKTRANMVYFCKTGKTFTVPGYKGLYKCREVTP